MNIRMLMASVALACSALAASAQISLKELKVNSLSTPVGLSCEAGSHFSWIVESRQNDISQQSYELSLKTGGKLVWTAKENSSRPFCTFPESLTPDTDYEWQVKVVDNKGHKAVASSRFHTGLQNWDAQWLIGEASDGLGKDEAPSPIYFSKQLNLAKKVASAVLYISSYGFFDASIGGKKVTDSYLNPGWTSYSKHLQYRAYDVKSMLVTDTQELQVLVTPGWWASDLVGGNGQSRVFFGKDLMLIAQLNITYADGTNEVICTDSSWKMSKTGPVCKATIYDGETIDKGVGFSWRDARTIDHPKTYLTPSVSEPVRAIKVLKPVRTFVSPKGEKIIDFGQNISGWERVNLPEGSKVVIRHAEDVDKEGNMNLGNLRTAKATSTFAGGGVFEPTHTFYGFRYISVSGLEGDIDMDRFEAVAISSDFDARGSFKCSDPRINQLQSNTWWSWRDNFVDVPTDCPQRSERLGWTGDAEVFFRTATFLGDINSFYRKWLQSLSDDQLENGGVTQVVPNTFYGKALKRHPAGWGDAATIIPWQHYMAYGDAEVLKTQYPSIRAWIMHMVSRCENNLYCKGSQPYGDWLSWRPENDRGGDSAVTSKGLASQSYYIASLDIAARVADILGYSQDAQQYKSLAAKAREAYMNEFVTPSGLISSDTQTAYVLALYFNIIPQSQRPEAVRRLLSNIKRYKDHITTGFLGTPHICEVLSEAGHSDVAYKLLLQPTCPGWMYQLEMGATTIWEHWDAMRPDRTLQNKGNVSLNHYSYGAVCDWLYRYAAGIRETSPGYETFLVQANPGGGLTSLEASTKCPYGVISVKWTAKNDKLTTLEVRVPVGTTAEIHCPDGKIRRVGSGTWKY